MHALCSSTIYLESKYASMVVHLQLSSQDLGRKTTMGTSAVFVLNHKEAAAFFTKENNCISGTVVVVLTCRNQMSVVRI